MFCTVSLLYYWGNHYCCATNSAYFLYFSVAWSVCMSHLCSLFKPFDWSSCHWVVIRNCKLQFKPSALCCHLGNTNKELDGLQFFSKLLLLLLSLLCTSRVLVFVNRMCVQSASHLPTCVDCRTIRMASSLHSGNSTWVWGSIWRWPSSLLWLRSSSFSPSCCWTSLLLSLW